MLSLPLSQADMRHAQLHAAAYMCCLEGPTISPFYKLIDNVPSSFNFHWVCDSLKSSPLGKELNRKKKGSKVAADLLFPGKCFWNVGHSQSLEMLRENENSVLSMSNKTNRKMFKRYNYLI